MTELIFVDPGMKVNSQYYRGVLLFQQMLPAIKRVACDTLIYDMVGYGRICAEKGHKTLEIQNRSSSRFWTGQVQTRTGPVPFFWTGTGPILALFMHVNRRFSIDPIPTVTFHGP